MYYVWLITRYDTLISEQVLQVSDVLKQLFIYFKMPSFSIFFPLWVNNELS